MDTFFITGIPRHSSFIGMFDTICAVGTCVTAGVLLIAAFALALVKISVLLSCTLIIDRNSYAYRLRENLLYILSRNDKCLLQNEDKASALLCGLGKWPIG